MNLDQAIDWRLLLGATINSVSVTPPDQPIQAITLELTLNDGRERLLQVDQDSDDHLRVRLMWPSSEISHALSGFNPSGAELYERWRRDGYPRAKIQKEIDQRLDGPAAPDPMAEIRAMNRRYDQAYKKHQEEKDAAKEPRE